MESNDGPLAELPSRTVSEEPNPPDPSWLPPYWHEDGDVILRIEADDTTKHDFRIHRLMLCLHSPVFRDMFSLGENVVKDEIPAVPMKGDSVEDVRELLKVIYKGFELYCDTELISFEGALGVLRLSHKYQMEQLKNSMIKLLKQSWPPNYVEYKQVLSSLSDTQKRSRITRSVKLIDTARITGCYELLPPAFFELANSNSATWTSEKEGAEFLCPEDWLRITIGKGVWMKRLKKLENAGLFVEFKAYVWVKNGDGGQERVSIFQDRSRSEYAACSGSRTSLRKGVKYCLSAFECLESLVGRKIMDDDSLVGGWTMETFQSRNVCSGCARWMANLIEIKENEIWENVVNDFDLPEVDKNGYTKTCLKRSFF